MEPIQDSPKIMDADTRVRGNTGAAALAGGLLILFGFFALKTVVAADLTGHAANVLCYLVRVGGLALIGVAMWSSFGHRPALLADAMICFLVGAAFVVVALLMLIDFGWWTVVRTLLYMICGTMFLNSGLRTWRDYRELVRLEAVGDGIGEEDVERLAAPNGSPLTTQLLQERGQRAVRRRRVRRRGGKADLVDIEPIKRAGRGALTTPEDQPISLDEAPSGASGGSHKRKSPPPQGYLADSEK